MLFNIYRKLRHSIVAFPPLFAPNRDSTHNFPPILGTGFVVHVDGLIATNNHVIEALGQLPRPHNFDGIPAAVIFFILTEKGMVQIDFRVEGIFKMTSFTPGPTYYGRGIPDLAFAHIKARDLLPVKLCSLETYYEEGLPVATAGFPMGTDQLMAPGWLNQLSPTVQAGIISAVHPFPCTSPHGFSIDVMTQGGASGSPVFGQETGEVVGVLYAGLNESCFDTGQRIHFHPTSFSWVIPSHFIANSLSHIFQQQIFQDIRQDAPSIRKIFAERKAINPLTGGAGETPVLPW